MIIPKNEFQVLLVTFTILCSWCVLSIPTPQNNGDDDVPKPIRIVPQSVNNVVQNGAGIALHSSSHGFITPNNGAGLSHLPGYRQSYHGVPGSVRCFPSGCFYGFWNYYSHWNPIMMHSSMTYYPPYYNPDPWNGVFGGIFYP